MSNTFYIDPIAEARDLGITVKECNPFDGILRPGDSGMIEKRDDGNVIIYYDGTDHPNRQRFTIAHEIGHYALGHLDGNTKKFRDTSKNYSLSNYDIQEADANSYAAKLLMPKAKIDFLIKEEEIYSISELARLFKVSKVAMTYRLKNLGWVTS